MPRALGAPFVDKTLTKFHLNLAHLAPKKNVASPEPIRLANDKCVFNARAHRRIGAKLERVKSACVCARLRMPGDGLISWIAS